MGWYERAAYNISFFGAESDSYLDGSEEIGSAVHRIVIKSILEIVQLKKLLVVVVIIIIMIIIILPKRM
jgi:hypothetical protein